MREASEPHPFYLPLCFSYSHLGLFFPRKPGVTPRLGLFSHLTDFLSTEEVALPVTPSAPHGPLCHSTYHSVL